MAFEIDESQPLSTQTLARKPVSSPGFEPDAQQPLATKHGGSRHSISRANARTRIPALRE